MGSVQPKDKSKVRPGIYPFHPEGSSEVRQGHPRDFECPAKYLLFGEFGVWMVYLGGSSHTELQEVFFLDV